MYEPVTLTESIGPKLENHNDHSTENTNKEKNYHMEVIIIWNAALKLCYIRLAFTGLMSTTNCLRLSQQLRVLFDKQ